MRLRMHYPPQKKHPKPSLEMPMKQTSSRPSMLLITRTALMVSVLFLIGCTGPVERAQDITLVVADASTPVAPLPASAQNASTGGPAYRVINVVRSQPDCRGDSCPSVTLKSLNFEGHVRFNAFLEQSLLAMGQVDHSQAKSFKSLSELANTFWKTAEQRYQIVLAAEVRRATPSIVVIDLQSYLYSGGAHGLTTSRYINWLPGFDRIITLNDLIQPGRMKAFEAALRKQYAKWLETNEFAASDRADYVKMWPFQFSDNAALMEDGIAVTFGHYVLGPYALGMPTILVPFSELKGIVNMGLLKRIKAQG